MRSVGLILVAFLGHLELNRSTKGEGATPPHGFSGIK
jgi:hypothetical protein